MNSEADEGELKVGAVAILSFIEMVGVKCLGHKEYSGLMLRELKDTSNPLPMLTRFNLRMVEFEAKFLSIDHEKLDSKYVSLIKAIIASWKQHGVSLEFKQDIQKLLIDKDGIPVYIEQDARTRELFKMMMGMIPKYVAENATEH